MKPAKKFYTILIRTVCGTEALQLLYNLLKKENKRLSKPEISVIMQTWHKHNVPARREAREQFEETSTLLTNTEFQQTLLSFQKNQQRGGT